MKDVAGCGEDAEKGDVGHEPQDRGGGLVERLDEEDDACEKEGKLNDEGEE